MKNAMIPMGGAFRSFSALIVTVSLCTLAVFAARADLLLYDGFATATDGQNRAAYSTAADECKLQSGNAKSVAWTTGLSDSSPWSDTSGVVFSFPNKGLSLPAAFADGEGDQFEARGGGAGYVQGGTPGSNSNN